MRSRHEGLVDWDSEVGDGDGHSWNLRDYRPEDD